MIDNEHILKDAGAVVATGYGEVSSVAKVVNLGNGLVRGNCIIDVSALEIDESDELYQLHLMGGNNASFTNTVALATLELGANEVIADNIDSKKGRYIMPFENEKAGTVYPFVRIMHVLAGTNPEIDYTARLEKDLPVTGKVFE